jgi:predicted NBD/HSP70 family sugar kinase
MKENISQNEPIVYLLQEVPGTKIGRPKFNIIGAQKFGKIEVLLREDTQIVRSPGPITYQLKRLLKNFTDKDYLLLSGDPKVIGLAIAVACDINNGKYKTLTWDKQEKMYYSTEFNIYERGEINEQDRL